MIPLLQTPESRLLLLLVTTEPAIVSIAFLMIIGRRAGKVALLSSIWSMLAGGAVIWKASTGSTNLVSSDLFLAPLLGSFAFMAWLVFKFQPDSCE